MKRLLTLIVAVAMAFAVSPAFASVNNSAHDFVSSTYGRCGTCHVPHAATTSSRLWRGTVTAPAKDGPWANSTVGTLCGWCHNTSTGGQDITNAAGTSTSSVSYHAASPAFNANNHGRTISRLTGAPLNHALSANGLAKPYMTSGHQPEAGMMECTSCHNPHNEGINGESGGLRPFLRAGATEPTRISGFCNDCHDDRYRASVGSSTNHPVLIAYNPSDPVDPRVMRAAVAGMNVPVPTAIPISNWSLGGKFEGPVNSVQPAVTSELIGCQSCHAVHNQDGTVRTSVSAATNTDGVDISSLPRQLLAASYANDAICEGCHSARGNSGAVGSNGGDHPYDASLTGVMVLDGNLWLGGSTYIAEKGSTGGAICTSCHKAHGANLAPIRKDNGQSSTNWCTSCHTSIAPAAHHSNITQRGSASKVDCTDCHTNGGSGAQAHNGFGYVFSISGGCTNAQCHGTADPVANNNAVLANIPTPHLTAKGGANASHFIGTFTNDAAAHTKGINVKTGAWSNDAIRNGRQSAYLKDDLGGALQADKSCYNGTSGASSTLVVRCESCHSVLGNIGATTGVISVSSGWENNLLLQDYRDDSKADGFGVNSDFCIGCHNKANGDDATAKLGTVAGLVGSSLEKSAALTPPGIHPMTGSAISRAADAGRTITTLVTTAADGTYADAAGAPVGPGVGATSTSYYAKDHMDCDSCHRPHLGKLNWTPSNPTVARTPSDVPVILENATTTAEGGSTNTFAPLCQECHNY